MSLIRQLWLLLAGTVLLGVVGSAFVTLDAARGYLETSLRLKNSDNAQALAISLSQQRGDLTLSELLIAAQFDTGFYERIRLVAPDGRVLVDRTAQPDASQTAQAPAWFVRAVPIASAPGVAQVSDGWRPVGTLEVVSGARFAHEDLWGGSLRSAGWLLAIGLLSGVLGSLVVRRIRTPLQATVAQAQALVERRFVTVREPRVPELRQLSAAMNAMVHRLQAVFGEQGRQLEALQREAQVDALTGLSDRGHFTARFASLLARDDAPPVGWLVLLRVRDLAALNRVHGHRAVDALLRALGQTLLACAEGESEALAGRLNGSDLALACAGRADELPARAAQVFAALEAAAGALPGAGLAMGAVVWWSGSELNAVMREADASLVYAESADAAAGHPALFVAASRTREALLPEAGESEWRRRLGVAVRQGDMQLGAYPLVARDGSLLHLESPLRLRLDPAGPFEPAARWLPWAQRSRMTAAVDLAAVALALDRISGDGRPRGINLSPSSLADSGFLVTLREHLNARPRAAASLLLEVGERAVVEHLPLVGELAHQCRPYGVKVGLEHGGERLMRIDRLYEAGLDFVKLDQTLSLGIASDAKRAEFLRGLVGMLHGLGAQVHAEGVVNGADADALWQCAVDGQTGPWISARFGTAAAG